MIAETLTNLKLFAPELTLVGFLIALFVLDAFAPKTRQNYIPFLLTIISCGLAAFLTWNLSSDEGTLFFANTLAGDPFSSFFRYLFFFACGVSAYMAYGSKELESKSRMEFCLLLLCVTFGLCLMATATNILVLYLGIETVSIVSFVMAGFNRENLKSNEASFKYFVFGALASGLMIYGFSLLYGLTGSLQYLEIERFLLAHPGQSSGLLALTFMMIYGGFAYKISAFPMHFWTPDVYEGAPTPVAAFFSIGPKAAGLAALIRFLKIFLALEVSHSGWANLGDHLAQAIALISAATMIIGNLCAIGQTNVKRLLAYSSIAHVGYMLMGLVSLNGFGLQAVLFYLVAYYAMNMGAFWVASIVSDLKGSEELQAFRGLGWTSPTLGVCMAVFLFSLTGIPMFAGFIGKFLLFSAVLKTPGYLWLAVVGVLNSVISLYYYAKILKNMWLDRPQLEAAPLSVYHGIGLVLLAVPTVVMGLFFAPVLNFASRALLWR